MNNMENKKNELIDKYLESIKEPFQMSLVWIIKNVEILKDLRMAEDATSFIKQLDKTTQMFLDDIKADTFKCKKSMEAIEGLIEKENLYNLKD